jgi:hypothetical protein
MGGTEEEPSWRVKGRGVALTVEAYEEYLIQVE